MTSSTERNNYLLYQPVTVIVTDNNGFYIKGVERHDGNLVQKQYIATDVEQAIGYIRTMLEFMSTN